MKGLRERVKKTLHAFFEKVDDAVCSVLGHKSKKKSKSHFSMSDYDELYEKTNGFRVWNEQLEKEERGRYDLLLSEHDRFYEETYGFREWNKQLAEEAKEKDLCCLYVSRNFGAKVYNFEPTAEDDTKRINQLLEWGTWDTCLRIGSDELSAIVRWAHKTEFLVNGEKRKAVAVSVDPEATYCESGKRFRLFRIFLEGEDAELRGGVLRKKSPTIGGEIKFANDMPNGEMRVASFAPLFLEDGTERRWCSKRFLPYDRDLLVAKKYAVESDREEELAGEPFPELSSDAIMMTIQQMMKDDLMEYTIEVANDADLKRGYEAVPYDCAAGLDISPEEFNEQYGTEKTLNCWKKALEEVFTKVSRVNNDGLFFVWMDNIDDTEPETEA